MSRDLMFVLIAKMHFRLNSVIARNNYDLQNKSVLDYSKRLDKVIARFNKSLSRSFNHKANEISM